MVVQCDMRLKVGLMGEKGEEVRAGMFASSFQLLSVVSTLIRSTNY